MPERIGKYEILRKIGTGGFGEVYEARDPLLKRTVAIKTCQVQDAGMRARFFREGELAGSLHHPNITTIHDSGLHQEMPYVVEELLAGEDLDAIIRRGDHRSIGWKLDVLIGIAAGLQHAHAAGIIHRDVKPGNIRVLEDGGVKIMDFGIAKSLRGDANSPDTGSTLGTSAYLAPEQIRGLKADGRTDIYSFGVLAYELLTGRKPFLSDSLPSLFDLIIHGAPVPITSLSPLVPVSLANAIHRALDTSPTNRQQTVAELREELMTVRRHLIGDSVPGHAADAFASTASDALHAADSVTAPVIPAANHSPVPPPFAGRRQPQARTIEIWRGSRRTLRFAIAAGIVFMALAGALVLLWPQKPRSQPIAVGAAISEKPAESSSPTLAGVEPAPPLPQRALEPGVGEELPPRARPQRVQTVRWSAGRDPTLRSIRPPVEIAQLPADRYTRAAMEPGLSDETRAHILLQSALEHHAAGDDRQARASLRAAFALSPQLPIGSETYGVSFARLARDVRVAGSELVRVEN